MTNEIYSESQKLRDVEVIIEICENLAANLTSVLNYAKRYNYPPAATSELVDNTDSLINSMFLLANYLQNPSAETIVKELQEKKQELNKILTV